MYFIYPFNIIPQIIVEIKYKLINSIPKIINLRKLIYNKKLYYFNTLPQKSIVLKSNLYWIIKSMLNFSILMLNFYIKTLNS